MLLISFDIQYHYNWNFLTGDKDYIFNRTITTSKKCDELIEIYNKWANENYSSKINHRA